jgi:hypothetical protein
MQVSAITDKAVAPVGGAAGLGASQRERERRVPAENGELLLVLGRRLESRGLDFRLVTYPGDEVPGSRVEQVVVTNPRCLERGEVRVSDDGTVTWEFPGSLDDAGVGRIVGEIAAALRVSGLPQRRGLFRE